MKKSKYDLTQGSIPKHLLYLAVPIFWSNFFQDAFSVVDMIFVGKLGSAALSAVALSGNLTRLIGVLSLGISTGTVVIVSQFIGAGQRGQGENIAMQALILSVVCALGIAFLGYPLAEPGLRLLGAEEEVIRLGVPYLRITLLGSILMFLSMTLNSIFRGAGDVITPLIVMVFSTILNIVLDPLLIFGIWKFPRLEVAGSAYATVIGRGLGVVPLLYLCLSGRSVISLRHVERRINLSVMGQIMKLGIFSAMQGLLRHASRLGFIRVVAIYGTESIAAYAICMRLRILVMHFGFAFANAVSPMVGQNLGANRIDRAEKSAQLANRVGSVIMVFIGLILLVWPQIFIRIFTSQTEVIEIGTPYLRFLSVTFGFMGVSIVLGRALNGAGDTVSPMVITGICQVGFALLLVIALSYLVGIMGIWIGIAVSNIVQGVVMWYWFRQGKWKTKRLLPKK
ncbi:MAG: MATE family efflux transporter [Candidatus Poribacteria bacterium]|nr:MATE family efflux transporter [Candidatus Poribacteria bacterium]